MRLACRAWFINPWNKKKSRHFYNTDWTRWFGNIHTFTFAVFALKSRITQASISLVCKPWLANGIMSARRILSTEVLEKGKTPKQNILRRNSPQCKNRQNLCTEIIKVYMTDYFLFARLNLRNVLICIAKKNFR